MKKSFVVFSRRVYRSTSAGGTIKYNHDSGLFKVLGNATDVRVQAIIHERSSANARAVVSFFESARDDSPPYTYEHSVGTAMTITTMSPSPVTFSGPFLGYGELMLAVDDSTASGLEDFDLEIWATAIYE